MEKVCLGYVRVSTKRQKNEGVGLETQKRKIRAWAEMNDYTLIGIEEDPGLSGSRMDNREGLQKAIKIACDKKAALITYSLSRLSRSLQDTLVIADRLEKAGADLVSLSEKLDTTSASGKMVFRILSVLNEFEREVLSERTASALQFKKSTGKVYSHTPYGYNRVGDNLVENETEQSVIAQIKEMRRSGESYRQIAKTLNSKGIPTKNNKQWHASTVRGILNNTLHE